MLLVSGQWPRAKKAMNKIFDGTCPFDELGFFPSALLDGQAEWHACGVNPNRYAYYGVA